ncbi:MAG: glycosyltransferase [Elusimicrobiota bacterium]
MSPGNRYIIHFDTGRSWRGGQNQVFLLMSGLKEHGLKQLLVTPAGSPLEKAVSATGIETTPLQPLNDIDIISGLRLRRIIKKERPDIVHFHTSRSLGIGAWALRGLPVKTVYTKRVSLPLSSGRLNLAKYRYPDMIVAISEDIKKTLNRAGLQQIERIYSAVNTDKFCPAERPEEEKVCRIGMAGAIDLRDRDYITYIKAAKIIKETAGTENVRFYIAGTGKDEHKVKKFIRESGLSESVEMSGFVEDMHEFFSSIDILVHTVNFEGLGTVILQAMASGVPVVATAVGGIPELIEDSQNGFLAGINDFTDVSEKVLRLTHDSVLRRTFRERSITRVMEEFSVEKMVTRYAELYEKL